MFTFEMSRSLTAAAALINTSEMLKSARKCEDELVSVNDLEAFLNTVDPGLHWPSRGITEKQLNDVKLLRDKIRPLWEHAPITSLPEVELVNTLIHGVTAKLVVTGSESNQPYRYLPLPASSSVADTIKASIGSALCQMIVFEESGRLRVCAGDSCEAVIVDMTRNRSKLFCDYGNCANRAHVRAYRARKAAEPVSSTTAPSAESQAESTARRLKKPSAAEKANSLHHPRSASENAARDFRHQMREELLQKRLKAQQDNKKS